MFESKKFWTMLKKCIICKEGHPLPVRSECRHNLFLSIDWPCVLDEMDQQLKICLYESQSTILNRFFIAKNLRHKDAGLYVDHCVKSSHLDRRGQLRIQYRLRLRHILHFHIWLLVQHKGRVMAPKRMIFWENSKRPLTPPLIFGKLCCKC